MKNLFTDLPSSLQTGFGAENHSLWPPIQEQVDKCGAAAPTVGEDPVCLMLPTNARAWRLPLFQEAF